MIASAHWAIISMKRWLKGGASPVEDSVNHRLRAILTLAGLAEGVYLGADVGVADTLGGGAGCVVVDTEPLANVCSELSSPFQMSESPP